MLQVIVIGLTLMGAQSSWGLSTHHSCTCAAMDTPNYVDKETLPLIERSLNVLPNCDPDATKMCNDLCLTLAKTTREDPSGGDQFCMDLKKKISYVKVSVFSKTCDHEYKYTGLTFDKPTCCENGKKISCSESRK